MNNELDFSFPLPLAIFLIVCIIGPPLNNWWEKRKLKNK